MHNLPDAGIRPGQWQWGDVHRNLWQVDPRGITRVWCHQTGGPCSCTIAAVNTTTGVIDLSLAGGQTTRPPDKHGHLAKTETSSMDTAGLITILHDLYPIMHCLSLKTRVHSADWPSVALSGRITTPVWWSHLTSPQPTHSVHQRPRTTYQFRKNILDRTANY